MATSRPPVPVKHCTKRQFNKVLKLARKLLNQGVYFNTTLFTNNPVLKADFLAATDKLEALIVAAKGNTDKLEERDSQTVVVSDLIDEILIYVLPIVKHDIEKINLSGFDTSVTPSPHTVAVKPVIRKVVKHNEENCVKVMLVAATGLEKDKKETRLYIVRVYEAPGYGAYTEGCRTTNSKKLIVRNVTLDKARYYAVLILNAAGESEISGQVKFTLTDN